MPAPTNRSVKGFPNFLSFGGFTDLKNDDTADFVAARASSVLSYARFLGGADDQNHSATIKLIDFARVVEARIGDEENVVPVIVATSYERVSNPALRLRDADLLARGVGKLISSLKQAQSMKDERHPVPAAYIINPSFIGACREHQLSGDYETPVREPLQRALDNRMVATTLPDSITNTLSGYIEAINWLVRHIAPSVSFGWHVDTWGGHGMSGWLCKDSDSNFTEYTATVAGFLSSVRMFAGNYKPDFVSVGRYPLDDLTADAYLNHDCYGPHEWSQFFEFCGRLGEELSIPVMISQISSARIPLSDDVVNDEFDSQHWGTGGSYLLGDAGLGSDYSKVNHKILALSLEKSPTPVKDVYELFQNSQGFDFTNPGYQSFSKRPIFAILLGSMNATGIQSTIGNPDSWVRDKLRAYRDNPVIF